MTQPRLAWFTAQWYRFFGGQRSPSFTMAVTILSAVSSSMSAASCRKLADDFVYLDKMIRHCNRMICISTFQFQRHTRRKINCIV